MVGETLSAGIGQGYFLTTAAQLSLALAQLINNGNKLNPKLISDNKIPNHFIKKISNREQLIHQCKIIPLEVVVRNIAAGSICKRLGIKEGKIFKDPIIEFYYKNDELNDPIVNNSHIISFGWSDKEELFKIKKISLKVNRILKKKI